MIFGTFIDSMSPEDYYQDCWLHKMPAGYETPSDKQYDWLWKYIDKKEYYQNLATNEKAKLQNLIKQIESTIPIITDYGSIAKPELRLYLAYQMAKPILHLDTFDTSVISSVVIYRSMKLRKKLNEAGCVFVRGKNTLLTNSNTLKNSIDKLIASYKALAMVLSSEGYLVSNLNSIQRIHKGFVNDVKNMEIEIKNSKQNTSEILSKKIQRLIGDISTYQKGTLQKLKTDSPIGQVADEFHPLYIELIKTLEGLLKKLKSINEENKVSIHLTWSNVLLNERKSVNIVIHEMAHVIDFVNSGLNGIPKDTDKYRQVWQEAYESESEKLKQGGSKISDYALSNMVEFFAACSELFFNFPNFLKRELPTIYESLTYFYRYESTPDKPVSLFQFIKLVYSSKMSFSKNKSV